MIWALIILIKICTEQSGVILKLQLEEIIVKECNQNKLTHLRGFVITTYYYNTVCE